MGEPVKVLDIANKMIEASGKKIDIVFTGLRPGEKLHEDLFGLEESGELIHHDLISRSFAPPVDPSELDRLQVS
jgi:dTDP-glucose 4,6-dehydratase